MCSLSSNFQLCTCELGKKLPDHYWELYRFVGEKNIQVIGEIMLPFQLDHSYLSMKTFLQHELNNKQPFDKLIGFLKKDVLILHIRKAKKVREEFGFIYNGKQWLEADLAPFELENEYDVVEQGLVKM